MPISFKNKNTTPKPYRITLLSGLAGFALTLLLAFMSTDDPPACVISCDQYNVIFIGVDNPMSILVSGIPAAAIKVTAEGPGIVLQQQQDYHYIVRATTPGEARITVSDGGNYSQSFQYRVKRIPDPDILLGNCRQGSLVDPKVFRLQEKLITRSSSEESDFKCDILSFDLFKNGPQQEGAQVTNTGPQFNSKVLQLIQQAKSEDIYWFDNVKVKCPGDAISRFLGSAVFQIK